jgi:hypothetical protein
MRTLYNIFIIIFLKSFEHFTQQFYLFCSFFFLPLILLNEYSELILTTFQSLSQLFDGLVLTLLDLLDRFQKHSYFSSLIAKLLLFRLQLVLQLTDMFIFYFHLLRVQLLSIPNLLNFLLNELQYTIFLF